jgi:hypothetical protein
MTTTFTMATREISEIEATVDGGNVGGARRAALRQER